MATEAQGRNWKVSIRLTVVGLFVIVTLLTGAVAIGLQYHFGAGMARDAAFEVHRQTADSARQYLSSADAKAVTATRLLAAQRQLVVDGRPGPEARPLFAETLRRNPDFYAVYLGFGDGGFHELVNLDSGSRVRERLQALPQDRWVEITVTGSGDGRRRELRSTTPISTCAAGAASRATIVPKAGPGFSARRRARCTRPTPICSSTSRQPGRPIPSASTIGRPCSGWTSR